MFFEEIILKINQCVQYIGLINDSILLHIFYDQTDSILPHIFFCDQTLENIQ